MSNPPTIRETEIVLMVADGLSSKMIADKLSISQNTVITHIENIKRKTGTVNTPNLVYYLTKHGFI